MHRFVQTGTTAQASVDKSSQFSGTQNADSMTVNNLSIGATYVNSSASNRGDVNIAELLFYDTGSLSAGEIAEIETGLMTHYNL